jgi:23S rRNA pseudouridine2457 synthase
VLCQFSPEGNKLTLKDFIEIPDIYPVGRLDMDSEGLLLLTDDNRLKNKLTEPKFESEKTYLVQVEGIPAEKDLEKFRAGLLIQGQKTKPAKAVIIEGEPDLPPRDPPIRYRKSIPTSWLQVTLTEGRNRQVRKMTAAIGFPTLRLIRNKIKTITLEGLDVGSYRFLTADELNLLKK